MRILIVRHGDPAYEIDGLTETGKKEAQLLAPRLASIPVTDFYVSPLGRARQTLQPALDMLGREAQVLDWLKEFSAELDINGSDFLQKAYPGTPRDAQGRFEPRIVWDMLPGAWMKDEKNFEPEAWRTSETAKHSNMEEVYRRTCEGLDELLARYGYIREGGMYVTEKGSDATIVLVCHFGITAVMLSHLWGVSPHILLHVLSMAPSSVTEIYTEERVKGEVVFRTARVGDISHLYAAGQEPSFACRFCEVYENTWQRH